MIILITIFTRRTHEPLSKVQHQWAFIRQEISLWRKVVWQWVGNQRLACVGHSAKASHAEPDCTPITSMGFSNKADTSPCPGKLLARARTFSDGDEYLIQLAQRWWMGAVQASVFHAFLPGDDNITATLWESLKKFLPILAATFQSGAGTADD